MIAIVRGLGTTPSERYLAKIAERTFLNLWSYPNLFIDKKENGKGNGKELCDLLVVFGDDIVIFSDKSVEWPVAEDVQIAWRRWYRRAIEKSVAQIRGAERWITEFPERVFLDAACSQRLPIGFPKITKRRVHGVIVAIGANRACRKHFPGSSGTFVVAPRIKGGEHFGLNTAVEPFTIGDVGPSGSFIHVFDDQALDAVMRELDTVSDFTNYLIRRERFIRPEKLLVAAGEEDLLACYLQTQNANRQHDFVDSDGKPFSAGERIVVDEGAYSQFIRLPEYIEKKKADRVSYVWDRLIETFTHHVLSGTSVSVLGQTPDVANAEQGLRVMAMEPRLHRRVLGQALIGAFQKAHKLKKDRYVRVVLPGESSADREVAYIFLILAYPKTIQLPGGYAQYRKVRAGTLHAYCLNVLADHRHLKRAVGIGLDVSSEISGRPGGSEDMLVLEINKWTDDLEKQAAELRSRLDILKPERLTRGGLSVHEYPTTPVTNPSRQQRRALEREQRKSQRRRMPKIIDH